VEVNLVVEALLHRTRTVGDCRPLVLSHLNRMTDRVGIAQFAHGCAPDHASGYRVDDLARLGIVGAGLLRYGAARDRAIAWIDTSLSFLAAARAGTLSMHNLRTADGVWPDQPYLGDHVGRSVWALGTIAATARVPAVLRRRAARQLARLDNTLAVLPSSGLRPCAYAVLGLTARPVHAGELRDLVRPISEGWRECASAGWQWPERHLAGDNARLPQAMLAAGKALQRPHLIEAALASLDWYVGQVGLYQGTLHNAGNQWREPGTPTPEGEEQPIDTAATIEALIAAWRHTDRPRYATLALRAYDWFLGTNQAGASLYDAATGGCHDGVNSNGVNRNEGAESTLAYYQSTLALANAGLLALGR
jgi:hypothetical protein